MSDKQIIIPFNFPFAILKHQYNSDPTAKEIRALADGQFCIGPLSLFEYNKHEEYRKIGYENVQAPELPLKCKEYYVVHSPSTDTIEINDHGRITYVKEIPLDIDDGQRTKRNVVDEEKSITPPKKFRMSALFQKMDEFTNEIKDLKTVVLSSEQRIMRRSVSTDAKPYGAGPHTVFSSRRREQRINNGHLSDDNSSSSTPLSLQRQPRKQAQTTVVKRTMTYSSNSEKKTKIPRSVLGTKGAAGTTPSMLSSTSSLVSSTTKKLHPIPSGGSSGYGQQMKKAPAPWAIFGQKKK